MYYVYAFLQHVHIAVPVAVIYRYGRAWIPEYIQGSMYISTCSHMLLLVLVCMVMDLPRYGSCTEIISCLAYTMLACVR